MFFGKVVFNVRKMRKKVVRLRKSKKNVFLQRGERMSCINNYLLKE